MWLSDPMPETFNCLMASGYLSLDIFHNFNYDLIMTDEIKSISRPPGSTSTYPIDAHSVATEPGPPLHPGNESSLLAPRVDQSGEMDLGGVDPDRPMPSGLLFVPLDIQLDGEFLTWSWVAPWAPSEDGPKVRYRHPKPGMLADFIRLEGARDADILAYARRWGVLGICDHGLPCSHNQYPTGILADVPPCLPILATPRPPGESEYRVREPLVIWRQWSRKAQALINISVQLNQDRFPRVEDWRVVKDLGDSGLGQTERDLSDLGLVEPPDRRSMKDSTKLDEAHRALAYELDGWISMGQIRPRISWVRQRQPDRMSQANWGARFSLDAVSSGPNLFGLLALNLLLAIARTSLAVCSACANAYIPTRRPNPNRRNYCTRCGLKAAQLEASRGYRRRKQASPE